MVVALACIVFERFLSKLLSWSTMLAQQDVRCSRLAKLYTYFIVDRAFENSQKLFQISTIIESFKRPSVFQIRTQRPFPVYDSDIIQYKIDDFV